MRFNIRTRLLLWLLATTVPVLMIGLAMVDRVSDRLTDNATEQLKNLVWVESQDIARALATVETSGRALAANDELIAALDVSTDREVDAPEVGRADVGRADVGRQGGGRPSGRVLARLAGDLRDGAMSIGYDMQGLRITDRQGAVRGQTDGFAWGEPSIETAIEAMDARRPVFGRAYVNSAGDELFGLALPVVTDDGSVVGSLLVENGLGQVVASLASFESMGETTEANLVQLTDGGGAEAITIRRFQRDSAFQSVHPASAHTLSGLSLTMEQPTGLHELDYRGVETIAAVRQIESVDWGLIIKMDRSEALGLSQQISRLIQLATVGLIVVIMGGWLTFVRPLGRRIKQTADASDRVARGEYESLIGDQGSDEISDLSRSIDRLATDLKDDIAAREGVEAKLRYQANHDELTGLINRQRAAAIIAELEASQLFSLLFIDLDRFKEINDTYGHTIGDEVLVRIAERLQHRLPSTAVLSRWGGDEFLVIVPGCDERERERIASGLNQTLLEPIVTSAGSHSVGMSIGGATSVDGPDRGEVIVAADAEMFRVKRQQASSAIVPADVMRMVETALSDDRIEPFFQPIVRVGPNGHVQLVSVEALVRIRTAEDSVLSPAEFLPALGDHQLAYRIDLRVMRRSIAALGSWHRDGLVAPDFGLALNIGPAAMVHADVLPALAHEIDHNNIDANLVTIEIPETVETVAPETLESFRRLGVRIAIDDVGVQYSNLERMVDLQADVAKLDRRWIPSMATAEVSKAEVLRSLVDQCKALGLDVIAEGIETPEQLDMLQRLGVDVFQGFLFARPLSRMDFEQAWCTDPVRTDVAR